MRSLAGWPWAHTSLPASAKHGLDPTPLICFHHHVHGPDYLLQAVRRCLAAEKHWKTSGVLPVKCNSSLHATGSSLRWLLMGIWGRARRCSTASVIQYCYTST